jgi:hypothetical protein
MVVTHMFCCGPFSNRQNVKPMPGSLDKKGGRRCHLLFSKGGIFLPLFLSNEHSSTQTAEEVAFVST